MVLALLLNTNLLEDPSDFMLFAGRFHPLVVHLPIGFLLLAAIAQFATRWPKFHPIKPFLLYLWGLGALSATLAVILGYLLSLSGDYSEDTLFWHKWSGVAVMVSASATYFISKKRAKNLEIPKWALAILALCTLVYTGHLGGNLTHGKTYLLEYAPNPVRGIAGLPPKTKPRPKVTVLDSADVFLDIIYPMMHNKCISCHNMGKQKGDLLLTSHAQMMKGGENGEVILPGDVEGSELFRRINLPDNDDDFMPSEGKRPLTEEEITIIEWWIATGAPSDGHFTEFDSEKKIQAAVNTYLGLDKNTILNKEVPPADKLIIDSLQQQAFVINRLMKNNYFLEANFSLSERELTISDLDLLLGIKEQLIWLNLSNSGINDTHLEKIGQLENLVKLNLSGNDISDAGIQSLEKLSHLETLNLYNTKVSKGILEMLPKLPKLQQVYLWQTMIDDSLIRRIQSEYPNLEISAGREDEPK